MKTLTTIGVIVTMVLAIILFTVIGAFIEDYISKKRKIKLKKKDEILLVFFILLVILSTLYSWCLYEHAKQQEESNKIIKELNRKTAELEDTCMSPYHFEPDVNVEDNDTPVVGSPIGERKSVPSQNGFFSYMDADCITSECTDQYKMKEGYQLDSSGIWTYDGRWCIAVGSYYTKNVGQYIDVVLKNGTIITGILADCKSDKDTDSTRRQNPNGSIVEFVVNESSLSSDVKKHGNCAYAYPQWQSEVDHIDIY